VVPASLLEPSRPFTPGPALIRRGSSNFLSAVLFPPFSPFASPSSHSLSFHCKSQETPRGASVSSLPTSANATPRRLPPTTATPSTPLTASVKLASAPSPAGSSSSSNASANALHALQAVRMRPVLPSTSGAAGAGVAVAGGGEEWPVFQTYVFPSYLRCCKTFD
jgi:hypothetical protein